MAPALPFSGKAHSPGAGKGRPLERAPASRAKTLPSAEATNTLSPATAAPEPPLAGAEVQDKSNSPKSRKGKRREVTALIPSSPSGHRVISALGEGVAAGQPPQSEPAPLEKAELLYGPVAVMGAGGDKAAGRGGHPG